MDYIVLAIIILTVINAKNKSPHIGISGSILLLVCPPLAVIGRGAKAFIVTTFCTIFGFWVLGSVVGAMYLEGSFNTNFVKRLMRRK